MRKLIPKANHYRCLDFFSCSSCKALFLSIVSRRITCEKVRMFLPEVLRY